MEENKKIIALCTSRIYDPQICGFVEMLNKKLTANNSALLIFTINSDLYWDDSKISAETGVFDIIPYDTVDAVIVMDEKIKSHTISNKIINAAKSNNKPVVIVDGYYEGVCHVNFNYSAGFEKAVRHVMEQREIKKPHIMAGIPDNPFSDERIEIFKKVISEYGITFDDSMLSYGHFWAVPTIKATEKIIESGDIPDAIICANDIMAINVCDVLIRNGYSVPGDVLVSGFDGYDEVFLTEPKITTVSCTTPELAGATADLILKIVNSDITFTSEDCLENILVVPELITNESTGGEAQSGYDRFMLNRFNNMFYRHHDATRIMYEISTSMQMSKNPDELVTHLSKLIVNDQNVMDDVSFVLDKHIFDIDNYFFEKESDDIYMPDYCIEYDARVAPTLIEREVDGTLLKMEDERFAEKISMGYPLIFNTLDYMNIPLGYICYDYRDYDITKYSRTANVTNTISMGIGGYVNMRYQERLTEKVNEMYKKDALTGLYNRIGFNNAFELLRTNSESWGQPITVIMSDLDGLKYINDNFGHAEGDNAISAAAQALKKACPEKAICVRFGGDELFSVILGDCDIDSIIKRVELLLAEYNQKSNKEYSVVASCGSNTSIFSKDFDITNALKIADEQMYNIKKNRRR